VLKLYCTESWYLPLFQIDDEEYCIQPSRQWTVDKEKKFASSSDSGS